MSGADLFTILREVLIWALMIGILTLALQRILHRASIVVQICLAVVSTLAVLIAGLVSAFDAMFISAKDLELMWYILAIASAVAVVVSVVFGRGVARNMRHLAVDAARIGRGESIAGGGKMSSELANLAAELKSTSHRLEISRQREKEIEQARQKLVTWVSHDLRTPLASMRAMAEALEDGVATDISGYHRRIIAQADQMAVLVNDLLELSKIQAGTMTLNPQRLDLYDLVSDAIADLAPLATSRSITMIESGVEHTAMSADPAALGRAIRNVILNAILYSPHNSRVSIAARSLAGKVVIDVYDQCGGISPNEIPLLFTAGWQSMRNEAKTAYSGAGIGLSTVFGIIKAHQGQVEVENHSDGCRFRISIPR